MAAAPAAIEPPPLEMDFGTAPSSPPPLEPLSLDLPPVQAPEPVRLETPDLTLDPNTLDFTPEPLPVPAPKAAPAAAPVAAANNGMIEFDLGALSLDLPGSAPATPPAAAAPMAAPSLPSLDPDATMAAGSLNLDTLSEPEADSPLATKLALAEEFNAIGDADGARSLAEEVLAEASGDLKSRAQRLLAEIG
jgi:pilus assembly protein FimV